MTRWLLFLDGCYPDAWLRLDDGIVTTRGAELASVPPEAADVVAVVPGSEVVLHWIELPALAPAQMQAAARLLGADVCGGAIDTMHVAIGAVGDDGKRPLALVERARMVDWTARLGAAGLGAAPIIPLPLLIPPGTTDAPAMLLVAGVGNVHAPRLAFAAEMPLVDIMLAGAAVTNVTPSEFEAGLMARPTPDTLDLRQGEFGPASPTRLDRRRLRRMAVLAMTAAGLWLAGNIAMVWRDSRAADRIEAQVADAARAALPRGTAIDAPRAQVAARADQVGAAGTGFTALAAPLVAAIRDRPGLLMQTLRYTPDTGLSAAVIVPTPADRQALSDAMAQANVAIMIGDTRDNGGKPVAEIRVLPR